MKSDSVPAFALEKEALKTEIEAGIQTGVEQMESGQKGKKPVEKYHNTRHLLRQYRKVAYTPSINAARASIPEATVRLIAVDKLDSLDEIIPRSANDFGLLVGSDGVEQIYQL